MRHALCLEERGKQQRGVDLTSALVFTSGSVSSGRDVMGTDKEAVLTMSWKKNQACCSAASLTVLVLTTHCSASSSWSSCTNTHNKVSFHVATRSETGGALSCVCVHRFG